MSTSPHYEFSEKYDPEHARKYFNKHNTGFWRRLSTWREVGMARKALVMAGRPSSVLDLPCGTGRFWAMLAEAPQRKIYVADNSQAMIDTGLKLRPHEVVARIENSFCCSAFDTGLPDNFVKCVFSIRLLHHIEKSEDRVLMLKEFARISSDTVLVSLWVDGNIRAWRHKVNEERKERERGSDYPRDRFVFKRADLEHDFAAANLDVVGHVDFIKYLEKWRTYVLRVKK
ncbi:MAG: class I SAM-dependent methyltransferase [Methylobacillus sp.]|jgi:ubiquinone/menaquinone biosynthesis C-methylase UbiE|nr:class I SAM-dependent methyltransferase [Methylobacillus sp.]